MKRFAYILVAMAWLAGDVAQAQVSTEMSNGWTFTFSGNVNTFLTYEKEDEDGDSQAPIGLVGTSIEQTRVQTGLLPSAAIFSAKGKEGNTDLSVNFGFYPQVQCATGTHDCFGAQIDMRQAYLTAGGSWGEIKAGRDLGLFGRQNILTDQTLFGVGATGAQLGGAGTTLGRIGFGYNYPQFKAQFTYSTPGGKPTQLSVGVFEAAANGAYAKTNAPRVEAEFVYAKDNLKGWVGGIAQSTKSPVTNKSATATGFSGGLRWGNENFSLTGSGYYGKGIGTILLFLGGVCDCASGGSSDLRPAYGYIGQFTYTFGKATLAGSYGASVLEAADNEAGFTNENALASAGLYYQATKSLKVVFEGNYTTSQDKDAGGKNSSVALAAGLMLFF